MFTTIIARWRNKALHRSINKYLDYEAMSEMVLRDIRETVHPIQDPIRYRKLEQEYAKLKRKAESQQGKAIRYAPIGIWCVDPIDTNRTFRLLNFGINIGDNS